MNPDALLTNSGAQIRGLSGAAVHRILVEYGIERRLSREGGRTSRGGIESMRRYVRLFQELDSELGLTDELYVEIEAFWVGKVREFFDSSPFELNLDPALGLSTFVREVLRLAEQRRREGGGMQVVGAVLQHLVGAKLEMVTRNATDLTIEHHSFSTADAPGSRAGDFELSDSVVHVTTYPGEAVMAQCRANISQGLRPIIVTTATGVHMAKGSAEAADLADRVDIFDVEQFVALNIYEWSAFSQHQRQSTVRDLLETYNRIVGEYETDPSLKIVLK